MTVKRATVINSMKTIIKTSSTKLRKQAAIKKLKAILIANQYPLRLIEKWTSEALTQNGSYQVINPTNPQIKPITM